MERSEVSLHEVKVYRSFLGEPETWLTHRDVETRVEGVAARTVRAHVKKLVDLGILDQAEVFPAHRYRLSGKAGTRNRAYMLRLAKAMDVFGATVRTP